MNAWIKGLYEELEVAISYEFDRASQDTASSATIRFTVTNSASPAQPGRSTEVRFDRVCLRVGLPSEMQTIEVGVLRPQDSTTVEYHCQISELPDVEYDVSGDISTQTLFHVASVEGNRLPGDSANLPPQTYMRMFKDMNVHQWLNSTIRDFPLPDPDTTLAQLSDLATPLNDAIIQIRTAKERLTRVLQFISQSNQQDRDALASHQNAVDAYLTETVQQVSKIRQTLGSSNVIQIASAIEHETERLERSARQMDQATEDLAKQIGPR
jgi:hypothetical protein